MVSVSIITPVYSCTDEELKRTETNIYGQTNKDFEWIIVADGNSDYQGWADVRLQENYGASVARNVGFQISSGQYITYLDMGDVIYPERVENIIKLMDTYGMDMMFSGYDIQEGAGVHRLDHFDYIGTSSRYPTAVEYLKLLQYQNISIPLGVAHTRRPFVEVGGFQRGIVCGEDGVLWRRMIEKIEPSKILFSNDVAGRYFVNPYGQSRTQRRPGMGGFAIDGAKKDNGRYLDRDWFKLYSSEGYYE